MSSHFQYFPSDNVVVTPYNAQYSYPSQVRLFVTLGKQVCKNDPKDPTKKRYKLCPRSTN